MAIDGETRVGDKVKDNISGLEGVAFGITDFMYGCRHIGIVPYGLDKDSKPHNISWLEEPRITVIERVKTEKDSKPERKPGGPSLNTFPK